MKFGAGQPVPRVEDPRLLRGEGRYTDDLHFDGELHGVMVRSPFAHAEMGEIDTAAVRDMPGVRLVWTADDVAPFAGPIPCAGDLPRRDGSASDSPPRYVLASGRVRYVGDPVAFIVADTLDQAQDAAEGLMVDYDPLPSVTDLVHASRDDAPLVWEKAKGNVSVDWEAGDADAVEKAIAKAAHVTRLHLVQNRVVPNPIEPRAAIARYDADEGFWLHTPCQGVWTLRNGLVGTLKDIDPDQIHIVSEDVGGGFGMKIFAYPEQVLLLLAARELGRPVRWTGERGEAFQADTHGRDVVSDVEMAFNADHRVTAYRVISRANMGAYHSSFAPYVPTLSAHPILGGVYRVPAIYTQVECMLTNTPPIDAYRGAGRPESNYLLERTMSQAAAELGLSQEELRRLNMIGASEMPYTNAMGATFDSGDFARNLDDALKHAAAQSFADRRAKAESQGRLRGWGMAYYIECALGKGEEEVELRPLDDGRIEAYVGTQSNGQGHATTVRQLIADKLGLPPEDVDFIQGDTHRKSSGGGTMGSRSLALGGNAVVIASDKLIERLQPIAAAALEVGQEAVRFADGIFSAKGTNETLPVSDALSKLAKEAGEEAGTFGHFEGQATTYPNGCHIAEVEIDPDTGKVQLMNYVVVDDFGRLVNPLIVEGQVDGGIVQGLGQALLEDCLFDPDSGQLLTGSFVDYAMPRADDVSNILFDWNEVPCQTNPLGAKGCGEAGTIGAAPAVMNAISDALRHAGASPVNMPATPEKLWRALQGANS